MEIDWNTTELPAQLEKYHLQAISTYTESAEVGIIKITLRDLASYAQSWGVKAGVWLVLAVVKMLTEIADDYRTEPSSAWPIVACTPPDYFEIVAPTEQEQEISHRILTAYNEIYAVLLRTHRQSSSPIWHRRSTVQYFPQLTVEGSGSQNN